MAGVPLRERGVVVTFTSLDPDRLVSAALALPGGTHVSVSGNWESADPWQDVLGGVAMPIQVDRVEAREAGVDAATFPLNPRTTTALAVVLDPCNRDAAWHVWHWWLHDENGLLLSFYDWDCGDNTGTAQPGLRHWVEELAREGVVELGPDVEYTDEWFESQQQARSFE